MESFCIILEGKKNNSSENSLNNKNIIMLSKFEHTLSIYT